MVVHWLPYKGIALHTYVLNNQNLDDVNNEPKNCNKKKGLIALFPLSFLNCAILHLLFFFLSDFAPHLLLIVFCSKSSLKEGKMGQKWDAKSLKKTEEGGAKSHNWQKDRGQKCNYTQEGPSNHKGGKKMGCKIA